MAFFKKLSSWVQKKKQRAYRKKYGSEFVPPQYKDIEMGNLLFGHSRGEYAVDREKFQAIFEDFFERCNFDNYGHYYHNPEEHYDDTDNSTYKNDTFTIRPYYWGDKEEIMRLPNFHYYPKNLIINWYKYPLRDAYSNQRFSEEELIEILNECERSMNT